MREPIPYKEIEGLRRALINWFQSQEAEPVAAAFVCAQLAGVLAAELATWHKISMPEGLVILERTMRSSAKQTMRQIEAEKDQ